VTWFRPALEVLCLGLRPAAVAAEPTEDAAAPPAAEQSTVPLRAVSLGLAVGAEFRPEAWTWDGSSAASPIVSPTTTYGLLQPSIAWSPLEWLEISFMSPGVTALLGRRNQDEFLLSGGIVGLGYSSVEGWIVVPAAGAAYRHWFSGATSVGVTAGWSGQYSQDSPVLQVTGGVFFTQTVGRVVSFNLGVAGGGWSSQPFELDVGSAALGMRRLPLIRFHLSPVWSIDLDAQLLLRFRQQPWGTLVGERVLLGFTAIW